MEGVEAIVLAADENMDDWDGEGYDDEAVGVPEEEEDLSSWPLVAAVVGGDLTTVRALLGQGADKN